MTTTNPPVANSNTLPPDTTKLKGTPLSNADKVPSNWEVSISEKGILAKNNITGRVYEGSIKDFNAFLKE